VAILNSLGSAAYNLSGAGSFMKGVRGARKDGLDLGDVGNIAFGLGQGALFAIPGGGGALAAGRVAAAAAKTAGAGKLAREGIKFKATAKGLKPKTYVSEFGKNIKTGLTTIPGLKQTAITVAKRAPIIGAIAGISEGINYLQNRQQSSIPLGTIQDKVTKQINAIQPTYNPSGRKGGPYSTENLFKGSFSTSGFPGLNVNQKPNLTIVKPNDGTLKPRTTQPPAAVVPKPVAPKAPVPPARRKPEDIYSFPIKTPPRVVQPPVTTRITQPTQPSTQTVTTPTSTTPPDTTRPRVYPDNYSGTTTFMDLNKDRIAAEAAKATEDIKRQNDYNTYLDEVKRNATLAEQQRFTQEQNDIVQRGALQQQRTQLENKEYGIPPYLEAASKRYQGGLARSQALGAIREQDIRDALSQRQMSARGRSAGTVGGLAPALLGSGLTGAGRSYKLDTRNEVLKRAEEQAALKESYDVYLAEAARQSQLEQLEDAKTRSLLVDQIRSLGSN
jgi:hypothetical protein